MWMDKVERLRGPGLEEGGKCPRQLCSEWRRGCGLGCGGDLWSWCGRGSSGEQGWEGRRRLRRSGKDVIRGVRQ